MDLNIDSSLPEHITVPFLHPLPVLQLEPHTGKILGKLSLDTGVDGTSLIFGKKS